MLRLLSFPEAHNPSDRTFRQAQCVVTTGSIRPIGCSVSPEIARPRSSLISGVDGERHCGRTARLALGQRIDGRDTEA